MKLISALLLFVVCHSASYAEPQVEGDPTKPTVSLLLQEKASPDVIRGMTFNILGTMWVNPEDWDPAIVPLLDTDVRLEKNSDVIRRVDADIICMQEVTLEAYNKLRNLWEIQYTILPLATHKKKYWEKYLAPGQPYQSNGNTIFLKSSRFKLKKYHQAEVSEDGNTISMAYAFDRETQKDVLVVAAHLDAEEESSKRIQQTKEIIKLIKQFREDPKSIILIGADMNDGNPSDQPLHRHLHKHHLINAWDFCGSEEKKCTHPFDDAGEPMLIDHLYLDENAKVLNIGALDEIPADVIGDDRIYEAMARYGSDHFPVVSDFSILETPRDQT